LQAIYIGESTLYTLECGWSAKIDLRPALSPCDGSIGDGGVGGFPISRAANLQHIFESVEIDGAASIAEIGRHAVPRHGSGVVGLYALAELIHPTKLIFCVAVALRRSFDEPRHGLGIVGLHAEAILKHIADVFLGVIAAMFRGFVKPGKSLGVILRLAPSFFSEEA